MRPRTSACLLFAGLLLAGAASQAAERPNFVILLADDLGYGDLACFGHPRIKTPNLDRLATQGVRLTHCYSAAANCSPARTGLMSGRTPYRVGVFNWIPMGSPMHMGRREVTVATLLRQAGYATCQVGKWHMNGTFNQPGQPQPPNHGFDYWFATQNNALPNHHDPDNFVRNSKPVGKLTGYSGQLVAAEAIRWLRELRDREKPFFLYVCFHEPHEPISTDPRFMKLYPSDDASLSRHHGNVTQMDEAAGQVLAELDRQKLTENTFVLFTSDNGPAITRRHPHGSTGGLREKKGHVYEGGIRVPGIIRWPGHTKAGTTSQEPVCGVDLLPTVCEITGVPLPSNRALDGASLVPLCSGQPIQRTTPLYWQFNFSPTAPKVAMRMGDWKLLATLSGEQLKPGGDVKASEIQSIKTAELDRYELYNLRTDPRETKDLASAEANRVSQMAATLKKLYLNVRSEAPVWPEWEWPRYEAGRIKWED